MSFSDIDPFGGGAGTAAATGGLSTLFTGIGGSGGIGSLLGGGSGGSGGLSSYGSSIFGSKPTVPVLRDESGKAIADANALLPGAAELASKANAFSQAQKNAMMSFVTPDWQKNLGLAGKDISSMLQGELPTSDIAQSQLSSVSRAIGGGYGDSPAMRNLVARDLGITQQQEIEKGLAANDRWIKTAESLTAPAFDFTKLFPSVNEEFSRDWQQSLITAAPDPVARGMFDEVNSLIGQVLGVYSGGPGYRGISSPNYGGGGGAGLGSPSQGWVNSENSYWNPEPGDTNVNIDYANTPANPNTGGWEGQ